MDKISATMTRSLIFILVAIQLLNNSSSTASDNDELQATLSSLITAMTSAVSKIDAIGRKLDDSPNMMRPKNCLQIQRLAGINSDIFKNEKQVIFPFGPQGRGVSVRCDFETDGGGWTIIQRRGWPSTREEFYREWTEYENGFGSTSGNYWIGLKVIRALASSNDQQELRIELGDWEGNERYARYGQFSVNNATDFYRLSIGSYTGNAGNAMMHADRHHQSQFSTKDADHDLLPAEHCAQSWHGGWWYGGCHANNLNGYYRNQSENFPANDGIVWPNWKGDSYSMKSTEMKIRDRLP